MNKIINRFITDTSARAIEIESGAVDVSLHVAGNDAARLETTKGVKTQIGPSYSTTYLRFDNVNNDTFADVNIRKALRAAIDMNTIVETVWEMGEKRLIATILRFCLAGRMSAVRIMMKMLPKNIWQKRLPMGLIQEKRIRFIVPGILWKRMPFRRL